MSNYYNFKVGDKIKILKNGADNNKTISAGDILTIDTISPDFIFSGRHSFHKKNLTTSYVHFIEAPKATVANIPGTITIVTPRMRVVANERPIPVDVDETLVMHEGPMQYATTVEVEDPLHPGKFILLGVNEPMIKVLMDEKRRGSFILVWSRSGNAWAEAVVKALGLTEYVDLVMTKPISYLDDTPVENWLKDRVWINPKVTYKKHLTK